MRWEAIAPRRFGGFIGPLGKNPKRCGRCTLARQSMGSHDRTRCVGMPEHIPPLVAWAVLGRIWKLM